MRTLRLHGIGESQVAELLGEPLLRATNPVVATYARHEAVDVRISARTEGGRAAEALADEAEAAVTAMLGPVRLGPRHDHLGRGRGRGARGPRLDAGDDGARDGRRARRAAARAWPGSASRRS